MKWFEQINQAGLQAIATALGLQIKRNMIGPCPSCSAVKRGSNDKRPPIGFNGNMKGWICHSCKQTGNVVDLIAYTIQGDRYRNLEKYERKAVMQWSIDNKLMINEQAQVFKPLLSTFQLTNQKPNEPVEVDTTSCFRWDATLYKQYKNNLNNTDYGKRVLQFLTEERKLDINCIDFFDLGAMIDDNGYYHLVIPLKDQKNNVVNMRFRSVPKTKPLPDQKVKKYIRSCQGRPMTLFNSYSLDHFFDDSVLITEGEFDVMAYRVAGRSLNVVSTTTGAQSNWPDEWLDMLEPFKNIYIHYDNDQAGKDGALKLAEKLGKYRCYSVVTNHNDFNEYLKQNHERKEFEHDTYIQNIFAKAKPFLEMGELKNPADYYEQIEELIRNPEKLKGLRTSSERIDTCSGGIADGLWVITGDTGHGKTTWATFECWYQATQGVPIMLTSFEQSPIGTVQKLLRVQLGNDFTKSTKEQRFQAMNQLGSMPLYILDQYGNANLDQIINSVRYAIRRYGVKIAMIDHLGFLLDPDKDERLETQRAVRELATIATNDQATIFLICHPNNMSVAQQRRVKVSDLKGASAVRQDAHVGVVVERQEITNENPRPRTTLWFDKVRSEFGANGSHCTLAFDPVACAYADTWEETPAGLRGARIIVPN